METNPQTTNPAPRPPVIQVDFTARRRPTLKNLGKGVYAYPRPCNECGAMVQPADRKCPACQATAPDLVFWERPFIDGRQTTRRLKSTTLRHAQLELGKLRSDQALSRVGRADDPYSRADVAKVDELLDFYQSAGCPQRNEKPRTGKQLANEQRSIANLKRHLGKLPWIKLNVEDLRSYHGKRTAEISANGGKRGPGHRTVDVEQRCLSAALRWAVRNQRRTGVDRNPIQHDRQTNCAPETVRHCRDVMPANGDELHAIARYLLGSKSSEVLAWQLLFESFTGQRTSEILRLRADAKAAYEPGFATKKHLYLFMSKTSKGTYPFVDISKEFGLCMTAHRHWLETRFPKSAWMFPSPVNPELTVCPTALTRAMDRACKALKIPHRTSHGLRSYNVNVQRSLGRPDAEIALRIGHKSGGKLIVEVYGEILPYKLSWLPEEGEPAWSSWIPGREPRAQQLDLGL